MLSVMLNAASVPHSENEPNYVFVIHTYKNNAQSKQALSYFLLTTTTLNI
jgi:hypothetical protein